MKKFIEFFNEAHIYSLKHQLLFSGLSEHEIFMFIQHSNPGYMRINAGSSVRLANEYSHMIGLVFSGDVYIYSVDYGGNKTMLKHITSGQSSTTLYAMFDYYNSLIELTASDVCEMLFIPPEKLFIADEKLAVIQQKILVNMLASQRESFLEISEHLTCLTKRSIRSKLLRFLRIRCEHELSYEFDIPYSRDELANYLAVDRASLSRTLGELKREGIIDFKKNHFVIKNFNVYF